MASSFPIRHLDPQKPESFEFFLSGTEFADEIQKLAEDVRAGETMKAAYWQIKGEFGSVKSQTTEGVQLEEDSIHHNKSIAQIFKETLDRGASIDLVTYSGIGTIVVGDKELENLYETMQHRGFAWLKWRPNSEFTRSFHWKLLCNPRKCLMGGFQPMQQVIKFCFVTI